MLQLTLIILAVIAVLFLIIFKITKKVVKTIFFVSSIFTAVIIVSSIFLFADVNDFRSNYPTQESAYVLEKDGKLIAGLRVVMQEEPKPDFFTREELNTYQTAYENNNLDTIKGDSYKLFIFKSEAFDTLDTIQVSDTTEFTKQQMFSLLESETPGDDYIDLVVGETSQKQSIKNQMFASLDITEDTEYKGTLFFILFGSAITQQGPLFIFEQYQEENIIIYPQTILFKAIKYVPMSLLNKVIQVAGDNNGNNG